MQDTPRWSQPEMLDPITNQPAPEAMAAETEQAEISTLPEGNTVIDNPVMVSTSDERNDNPQKSFAERESSKNRLLLSDLEEELARLEKLDDAGNLTNGTYLRKRDIVDHIATLRSELADIEVEDQESNDYLPIKLLLGDVNGYFKRYIELIDSANLALANAKQQEYTEKEALDLPEIAENISEADKLRHIFFGAMKELRVSGQSDVFDKVLEHKVVRFRDL